MPKPPDIGDDAEGWLEEQSEHLANVTEIAGRFSDAVAERYMELLADPSERNEAIAAGIIGYLYLKSVDELGDPALAAGYWKAVDEYLDLSWEDLHSIPPVKRGDIWNTAREVMDTLAARQARVDTGFAAAVLHAAATYTTKRTRQWNKLTAADQQKLAKASGIKQRVEQKTKERAGAVR